MIYLLTNIDETTRIVRIQRDLPQKSAKNPHGYENFEDQPSNLEQIITEEIGKQGLTRQDIRFHEPGIRFLNIDDLKYYVNIKTDPNNPTGTDIYISAETLVKSDHTAKTKDFRVVWGYCRVRIIQEDDETKLIKFFKLNSNKKFAMLRELKVNRNQHGGIGSHLIKLGQEMATKYGMTHMTVTSAVGVRDYYRKKHGFQLDDSGLMFKELKPIKSNKLSKLIRITDTKFQVIPKTTNWMKIIILIILSLIVIISLILLYNYFL
jgi:histone acetyltransferase (RNA polymerase elongator complex component)